jgi:dienelactone hydrolase
MTFCQDLLREVNMSNRTLGWSMKPPITTAVVFSISLLLATGVKSAVDEQVLRPVIVEELIPLQALAPTASDGFSGEAFIRKPPGEGPFPAVVLVHGGAPRWSTQMLREYAVHIHASRFLEAGYVIVAMTRRDLDLALPFSVEQPAVKDALAVIDAVKELPYVDANNIVLRGTSVGGYLVLEVAAAREVAAIVVEEPFSFPFVGISPNDVNDQSPDIGKISRIKSPIMDIEGDQTPNINNFNREVFIPAVQSSGKSITVLHYAGELHSFAFYDSPERTLHPAVSLEAFNAMDRFFREHLTLEPIHLQAQFVEYEVIPR